MTQNRFEKPTRESVLAFVKTHPHTTQAIVEQHFNRHRGDLSQLFGTLSIRHEKNSSSRRYQRIRRATGWGH